MSVDHSPSKAQRTGLWLGLTLFLGLLWLPPPADFSPEA
jgi:hypothetical protein